MNEAATAVWSLTFLLGIVVLAFFLYPRHSLDVFRQDMFALRDSLFDEATAGSVAFDSPAYGILRTTMNGFIRYGHRLSFLQAIIFMSTAEPRDREVTAESSFPTRWQHALADETGDTRDILLGYANRMNSIVLKYLVLSSPLLVLCIVPAILGLAFTRVLAEWLRSPIETIDTAALAIGEA